MTEPRILVVEDDQTLREGLCEALMGQGYQVQSAADGWEGQKSLAAGGLDLVVLDLMLPGPGGLELLKEFRQTDASTPVLILTARGDESDKVIGLELGADDYVTKPYGLRELLARVSAHLRRSQVLEISQPTGPLNLESCTVDLGSFQVIRDGESVGLSPREAAVLQLLIDAAGRAVPRDELLDRVWGSSNYVTNRTIDTHVLHLRKKIETNPKEPQYLLTV
ncbi:MAG: response regulator transcription factor, partial [Sulfitobacter sp.]|nr:response regulator transcription factor [Sulfitobacter sp.]